VTTDDTHAATTAAFWDAQSAKPQPVYWFFYPAVRASVNVMMTGVDWGWPQLWLKSQFDLAYVPRKHGLSIGCGVGNLERSLRRLNVCETIDGVDLSPESIRQAKENAAAEGITGLTYRVEDCERAEWEESSYDAVFFNHALHHIADVDGLLARVNRALRPGGFVYIDDYIGPSRDEWQSSAFADRELAPARDALSLIPESMRLGPLYPPLDLTDPSEMIRSDRILPAVRATFDDVRERPYWGNLLFPLLNVVDGEAMSRPEHQPLLRTLIDRERDLVNEGRYTRPLFAFLLAMKRE
jgi:SAM-dependent methyltransferase